MATAADSRDPSAPALAGRANGTAEGPGGGRGPEPAAHTATFHPSGCAQAMATHPAGAPDRPQEPAARALAAQGAGGMRLTSSRPT